MKLRINPLTKDQIRTFITWAYPEPYNIYDMSSEDNEEAVSFFLIPITAISQSSIIQGISSVFAILEPMHRFLAEITVRMRLILAWACAQISPGKGTAVIMQQPFLALPRSSIPYTYSG